jgi:hypothetical protein
MLISYLGDGAANALQIGAPIDAFNDAGTLGAMGFCGGYVLISLAAPFYLMKIGQAKPYHWILSLMALLLLVVPIVGLVWPVPLPAPMNITPYAFGAYILAGCVLVFIRSRTKSEMESIRKVLDETAVAGPATAPESAPAAGKPAMA